MPDRLTPDQVDQLLAGDADGIPPTPEIVADFLLAVARRDGSYRRGAIAAGRDLDRLCTNNAASLVAAVSLIVHATGELSPGPRDRLRAAVPHLIAALAKGDA